LQQKMDSVAFSQERMKRQLDDLQDRTQVNPEIIDREIWAVELNIFIFLQGAPTEIFDMRERMMVRFSQKCTRCECKQIP